MVQNRVRVYLTEVVTHSFVIDQPTDDDETLADAADGAFTHCLAEELEGYNVAYNDRTFTHAEPA
ncbi:hypothetical protein [Aureimonas frigidaquae]|uniref:hypothetical protein n=1 Tax=Aureimonas frigidaquae TaxID=424757 RepID=UPI0007853055|nr:hypothetical protein [Aureimonas frigidaquae]